MRSTRIVKMLRPPDVAASTTRSTSRRHAAQRGAIVLGASIALCLWGCGGEGAETSSSGTAGDGGSAGTSVGGNGGDGRTMSAPCVDGADCREDQFCRPTGLRCDDGFGSVCTVRPTDCSTAEEDTVCGCDGRIYSSLCVAEAAGAGAALYDNRCTPPPDTFSCGRTFCEIDAEVCLEQIETSFTCVPYPPGCDAGAPTCDTCTPRDLPLPVCSCNDVSQLLVSCTI